MASEEKIFEYFFANLVFRLPWQSIKYSDLEKFIWLVIQVFAGGTATLLVFREVAHMSLP